MAFSCEHRLLFSVKTTITIYNIRDTVYNSNYILGSYCFHRKRESVFTGKQSVYTQETPPLNRDRQKLSTGILCRMSTVTEACAFRGFQVERLMLGLEVKKGDSDFFIWTPGRGCLAECAVAVTVCYSRFAALTC